MDNILEKMKLTRPAFAYIIGVISVFLLISVFISFYFVRMIEDELRYKIETSLPVNSLSWVNYEIDGTLVNLSGNAPEESEKVATIEALSHQINHENIIDKMIAGEGERDSLIVSIELIKNRNMASVVGILPVRPTATDLYRAVANKDRTISTLNLIERSKKEAPTEWQEQYDFLLFAVDQLDNFKISSQLGQVHISALVDDRDAIAEIEKTLLAAAPEEIELNLDIYAPRPIISPFAFAIDRESGDYNLRTCSATDVKDLETIEKSLSDIEKKAFQKCDLGLGASTENWGIFVSSVVNKLKTFEDYELLISDNKVELILKKLDNRDEAEKVVSEIRGLLPPGFNLNYDNQLSTLALEKEKADTGIHAFKITKNAEGTIVVDGFVKNKESQTTIENLLAGKFDNIENVRLNISKDLPALWDAEIIELLTLTDGIIEGQIEMYPDIISVVGSITSEEAKDELSKKLADRFTNFKKQIELTVAEVVEKTVLAGECVNEVSIFLEKEPMVFEPNSTKLLENSTSQIPMIAETLSKCREHSFEIAGFTDSSGNNDANLKLSKDRAAVVLDAILSQNLAFGTLISNGYGEADPIASNETAEGRSKNRRIEIRLAATGNEPIEEEIPTEE